MVASTRPNLAQHLVDPHKPSFLFGCTPPREGTAPAKAIESCQKFANRSAVMATDGVIVYDIQDEDGRTDLPRVFPYRKTLDPSDYGKNFPIVSGKECVIYKCAVNDTAEEFANWLDRAMLNGHNSFVLVGGASSKNKISLSMKETADIVNQNANICFGSVAIAERHTKKGNEHLNMIRKQGYGSKFFCTQGIFDAGPITKLIKDYGDMCKSLDLQPRKIILTFAPCGREKTMQFIKWLGMEVPESVEKRIFGAKSKGLGEGERDYGPVRESCKILEEILGEILEGIRGSNVQLGINVESLSIFREEIDAAHTLFSKLQSMVLNESGQPWAIKWYRIPTLTAPRERTFSKDDPHWSIYDDVEIVDRGENTYNKRWNIVVGGIVGVAAGWLLCMRLGNKRLAM